MPRYVPLGTPLFAFQCLQGRNRASGRPGYRGSLGIAKKELSGALALLQGLPRFARPPAAAAAATRCQPLGSSVRARHVHKPIKSLELLYLFSLRVSLLCSVFLEDPSRNFLCQTTTKKRYR